MLRLTSGNRTSVSQRIGEIKGKKRNKNSKRIYPRVCVLCLVNTMAPDDLVAQDTRDAIFKYVFLNENDNILRKISLNFFCKGPIINTLVIICSGNGLLLNRWQVTTWISDDLDPLHHMVWRGHSGLTSAWNGQSPTPTWFWLELVGNCCERLKIIMECTNIQFCEWLGHGWQFHPLG